MPLLLLKFRLFQASQVAEMSETESDAPRTPIEGETGECAAWMIAAWCRQAAPEHRAPETTHET
jgi:hypothetical protein